MSHTMNMDTEIRDLNALDIALKRLGYEDIDLTVQDNVKVYGSSYTGVPVQLKGWNYPIVIDSENGRVTYDNYNGSWGNIERLQELKAHYGIEKAKIECRKAGHSFHESVTDDGLLQLRIAVNA